MSRCRLLCALLQLARSSLTAGSCMLVHATVCLLTQHCVPAGKLLAKLQQRGYANLKGVRALNTLSGVLQRDVRMLRTFVRDQHGQYGLLSWARHGAPCKALSRAEIVCIPVQQYCCVSCSAPVRQ